MGMKQLIACNCILNPTMITVMPEYYNPDGPNAISFKKIESYKKNLSKKRENNVVSKKSRKKINSVVNWLCYSARVKKGLFSKRTEKYHRWKVNFITLTLQAEWVHMDAKEFQQLFNSWLSYARKYFLLKNYVWKLERTKKGTLHVHITSDTFINYRALRDSWNRILRSKGFLDNYAQKYGHFDANSTDIKANKKGVRNMAAYLCKEMAKSDTLGKKIEGRLWGCNYELSRAMNQRVTLFTEVEEDQQHIRNLSRVIKNWKDIVTKPDAMGKSLTLGSCFFPEPRDWLNEKLGVFREMFLNTITYLRSGEVGSNLFYSFENRHKPKPAMVSAVINKPNYIQLVLNMQP